MVTLGTSVINGLKMRTIVPLLRAHIHRDTHVMTDEARQYLELKAIFNAHGIIRHAQGEYGASLAECGLRAISIKARLRGTCSLRLGSCVACRTGHLCGAAKVGIEFRALLALRVIEQMHVDL